MVSKRSESNHKFQLNVLVILLTLSKIDNYLLTKYVILSNYIVTDKNIIIMGKKLIFNNTYKSGHMSYLVIKDKKGHKGVCLEFDLIINCDTLDEAKEQITELSRAWLENVIKNKLPEELLNKPAPAKYRRMFGKITEQIQVGARLQKSTATNKLLFGGFESYPTRSQFA